MRVLLAGALALACSGVAYAAPTPPDWDRKPTAEDIRKFYPDAAKKARAEGRALVACGVSAEGRPHDCQIRVEVPKGLGFGDAAVAIVEQTSFKPATENGHPIESPAPVAVPISFRLTILAKAFGAK